MMAMKKNEHTAMRLVHPNEIDNDLRRPSVPGRGLRRTAFALFCALLLGAAGAPPGPAAPGTTGSAPPVAPAPESALPGAPVTPGSAPPAAPGSTLARPATPSSPDQPQMAQSAVGDDYVIGPGDTIQVFVWRNPELSTTVPVRPDGKVSTPLVEDMVAVGKTPSQLARAIEARLAEYVRSPQVNVIVTNPQSAYSKITVVGNVSRPGTIPYREGMTVLDVVLASGGLSQFAAGNRAKLVRQEPGGKTREIKVRLDDLVKKGKIKDNIEVRPGDLLVVPESYF